MCNHLQIVNLKGEKHYICEARGTAYCTLSKLEFPAYAIDNPEVCKNYKEDREC